MKWLLLVLATAFMAYVLWLWAQLRVPAATLELPADHPGMLAARQQAIATLDAFIERLAEPPASQSSAAIKVRLDDGAAVEHAWLKEPRFDKAEFVGLLDNDLVDIRRWRAGDTIRVPTTDVSDWFVIDAGELVGGYSIRAALELMSPQQRVRFLGTLPFQIQD